MAGALSPEAIAASKADAKIALLATVSPEGLPHVTLITSLEAPSPTRLMWGQFCEGSSKAHVRLNPRAAFLFMNRKMELWRGRCLWRGSASEGADYEFYNRKPMFRYNSYFGIHTVHYMDLVEATGKECLSLFSLVGGSVVARLGRLFALGGRGAVLNGLTKRLLSSARSLKFAAFVDEQGFPRIVPGVASAAAEGRLVLFSNRYARELGSMPPGAQVAVYAINLEMESVLVRGPLAGFSRYAGFGVGRVEVNWVYNSMPPLHGVVYPRSDLLVLDSF